MSMEVAEVENEQPKLGHIVVTGAKGALGSRVVETFRRADCTVTGLDIVVDGEDEVHADAERERLYWRHVDVADADSVESGVRDVEREVAPIDALVHCAGGFRWSLIGDIEDEDLDFLLDVNLRSALLLTRQLLPKMREREFGRILYMSSKSTLSPGEGEGPYTSTKSGLNALTKAVAAEVKQDDVNVNAVLPSVIDTPQNREDMPDADFDRWVDRKRIAEILFRFTQPFGDPLNGALLPVAGQM